MIVVEPEDHEGLNLFLSITAENQRTGSIVTAAAIHLDEPHFADVKDQSKRYLLRANDEEACNIAVGDMLLILPVSPEDSEAAFPVCIIEAKTYPSFAAAISDTPLEVLLPGVETEADAVQIYEALPGHTTRAEKYGVVRHRIFRF